MVVLAKTHFRWPVPVTCLFRPSAAKTKASTVSWNNNLYSVWFKIWPDDWTVEWIFQFMWTWDQRQETQQLWPGILTMRPQQWGFGRSRPLKSSAVLKIGKKVKKVGYMGQSWWCNDIAGHLQDVSSTSQGPREGSQLLTLMLLPMPGNI